MPKALTLGIGDLAEQIALDDEAHLMSDLMCRVMDEFRSTPEEFGVWMQKAMNRAQLSNNCGVWGDKFLADVECAAFQFCMEDEL